MWSRLENGAWPTHCAPSPPMAVKPTVLRSIHSAMKWQPMPAAAIEPSGTLVEELCGQPEQKNGVREPMSLVSASIAWNWRSFATRAAISSDGPMVRRIRSPSAMAISLGSSAPLAGNSQSPRSSFLPTMTGCVAVP